MGAAVAAPFNSANPNQYIQREKGICTKIMSQEIISAWRVKSKYSFKLDALLEA